MSRCRCIEFAAAWLIVFLLWNTLAVSAGEDGENLRDEAAQPCPTELDSKDRAHAWWCGYDPSKVVASKAGRRELTAFREHPYANIAAVPTTEIDHLDWTCIEGACGGLLDPKFIIDRELSHLWSSAEPEARPLKMSTEQWERAVKGRNSWLIWSGGNHGFWNYLARRGYGLADFLKLLDNRHIARANRFRLLGVLNEPGMRAPTGFTSYVLALDVPVGWKGQWPPPPGTKLPPEVPDPYVYGYSSGVMGMRLFPNPSFFYGKHSSEAQRNWDPERFLIDTNYAKSPNLIRPYRVGIACGFCHVSFNPIKPPADPAEPKWQNITSTIGNQYLKFGRIAAYDFKETNILWQLVNYSKPGTVDTSLVATDGINNPNTITGVFNLLPRMVNSLRITETAKPVVARQPVLDLSVLNLGLPALPDGEKRHTMRVLAGGEDSVGGRLALARVYLNIGTFHEYWKQSANLLVGVRPQTGISLDKLKKDSVYWNINFFRAQNMAEYLTYASGPLKLKDAPGGNTFVSQNLSQIERGRKHFVSHCMVCHSTRQPEVFWSDPTNWQRWVKDSHYLAEASRLAARENFETGNYFATDMRYPITEIGINSARFLSDNARQDRVWEDFSSREYKAQTVLQDSLTVAHPYDPEKQFAYRFTDRTGPARVRPLSLVNMWATAPYLHNNAVGRYPIDHDPANYSAEESAEVSVQGRMKVFANSVEQLLHLRDRQNYRSIQRTTVDTSVEVPRVVVLDFVRQQLGAGWVTILIVALVAGALLGVLIIFLSLVRLKRPGFGRIFALAGLITGLFLIIGAANLLTKDEHHFGRIPKGTPVNLLVNLNGPGWLASVDNPELITAVAGDLAKVWIYGLPSLNHPRVPNLIDNLLKLNKAPDLVIDRGHDFGGKDIFARDGSLLLRALTEPERRELVEYLKTL